MPISIGIVTLGNLNHIVNLQRMQSWHSKVVKIVNGGEVRHRPNALGMNWDYPSVQLQQLVAPVANCDLTIVVMNAPLEANYYMRRISANIAVISLHEMAEIVRAYGFSIENFLLRNIYELAVLFSAGKRTISEDAHQWAHDDTRGCLFDMNARKTDIRYSLHQPILCDECKARVSTAQLSDGFLPELENELRRIKKPLSLRIIDFAKGHPLWALAITAISSVVLNLVASMIFEVFTSAQK